MSEGVKSRTVSPLQGEPTPGLRAHQHQVERYKETCYNTLYNNIIAFVAIDYYVIGSCTYVLFVEAEFIQRLNHYT